MEIGRIRGIVSFVIIILGLMIVSACNRKPSQSFGQRPDTAIAVSVETVRERDLQEFITITGKLEGITDITLLSETSGRIIAVKKNLGDWVDEGAELAVLDNEVYQIRLEQSKASLLAAETAFRAAEINYKSAEKLYEKGNISQSDYQQSLLSFQGAIAQKEGAEASLKSAQKAYDDSRLIVPVSGYISAHYLKIGESVFPNMPLVGIVNPETLILNGGVGENNIKSLRVNQKVYVEYKDKQYEGVLSGFGIKPSPNTANYPIKITIANKNKELLPGMVVSANILTYLNEKVIYTEAANSRKRFDDVYVMVVNADSKAELRKVDIAKSVAEQIVIKSGLNVGDRVVVEGIDLLEEGVSVTVGN